MRTRSVLIPLAAAVGALSLAPGDADARGGRPRAAGRPVASALTRPPGAPDRDAAGVLRRKPGRLGDRLQVRLRRLDALHVYTLREAGSGATLARVETRRGGTGTARLRRVAVPAGTPLEVVDEETGEAVLEGEAPDTGCPHDAVRKAEAEFEEDGVSAEISLRSDTNTGSERMEVEANLPADGAYELFLDDGTGTMTSVGALTAEGADDADDDADGEGEEDDSAEGADDDGDEADDADDGAEGDDDGDPDATGLAEFVFSVDTRDGSELPLGATTLDELAGRAFEIRDAAGTVLLSGSIPAFEDGGDDDADDADDDDGADDADEGDDGADGGAAGSTDAAG